MKKKSFVQEVAEDLFRAATEVAKERAKEIAREIVNASKENAKLEAKRRGKGLIIDAEYEDIPEKAHPALPEARRPRPTRKTDESSPPTEK